MKREISSTEILAGGKAPKSSKNLIGQEKKFSKSEAYHIETVGRSAVQVSKAIANKLIYFLNSNKYKNLSKQKPESTG